MEGSGYFEVSSVVEGRLTGGTVTSKEAVETLVNAPVEAMSDPDVIVVKSHTCNAFLETFIQAFQKHLGISLTPDDLWLTIHRGFAACVNKNPEIFRERFVGSQKGKETITIRRDDFVRGNSRNDWTSCLGQFQEALESKVGSEHIGLLCPTFSTSNVITTTANTVCLMDTLQSYFSYQVFTKCGIPWFQLHGTYKDWEGIVIHIDEMAARFPELIWWLESVRTIAEQFCQAYRGIVDGEFWRSIFKLRSMSGTDIIDGHILRLFPYLKNGDKNRIFENKGIRTDEIPASLSSVPFIWNYYGTELKYLFYSGHTSVIYEELNRDKVYRFVRPQIGWAVRDDSQN